MVATSVSSGGRSASGGTVLAKKRTMIEVPFILLDELEAICTGFRMACITCGDIGGVATHGGMGSQFAVTLNWKGKHATITSVDLLAAWVRTFDPKDADEILKATMSMDKSEDPQKPRRQRDSEYLEADEDEEG